MTDPAPRTIDLDAARAARAEKREAPPEVILGGKKFVMPDELPSEVVHAVGAINNGDVSALVDAMEALFGGKYEEIRQIGMSWDDEQILLDQLLEAYGFTLPESEASGSS